MLYQGRIFEEVKMSPIIKNIIMEILNTHLKMYKNACPENITDLVFLEIEKNKKYLDIYGDFVNRTGRGNINKQIGKFIREYWDLKNLGRCNFPQSSLISSYEKHSN